MPENRALGPKFGPLFPKVRAALAAAEPQTAMLTLRAGIRRLQATSLTAQDAKVWIYDVFARCLLPLRYFPHVVETYHTVTMPRYGATLWALHNAVTTHLQTLPPGPAFRATVRLGQLCGLH